MSVRVFYDILNQKGTPAMYTDTFANRPAYGYQGRLFISTDSGQIFEDTGSSWTLVADAGVGGGTLSSVCLNGNTTASGIVITAGGLSSNSITNTGNTTGSVLFAGTGGLESQSNSTFFWDNTNKRLGIGTASPGAPLDIHGTGTNAHFNGTGTNNAYLVFQNAGTSKWRIGNTYNSGVNSFDIYNTFLASTPLSISSGNVITYNGLNNFDNVLRFKQNLGTISTTSGYTTMYSTQGGGAYGFGFYNGGGVANFIDFPTSSSYLYTFPNASGTLALTSNIPSVSGTTNYISKFTASTTLGNSLIYDNGTNVAIGTTTDNGNKLNVNGTIYSNTNITAAGTLSGGNINTGGYNQAARFFTQSTTVSVTFNAFQTIYTLSDAGIYLFQISLDGNDTTQWSAAAIVMTAGGSNATTISSYNSALVVFQLSGMNLQIKQTGTSPNLTLNYRVLKIS